MRGCGVRTCPSSIGRQAVRIERCLHQKCLIHRVARALHDNKPADAPAPPGRASLHAAYPAGAPAAPFDAAEPALPLTREQLQEVMGIVSAHHRGSAAGPSEWTFEIICVACQSSEAAIDVTLELGNLSLSGELPWETFLLDGLLIGLEKPGGGVRPIAISEMWCRISRVCALRTYRL